MDQTGEDLVEVVHTSDTHFLWLKKNEWKRLEEFGIKRRYTVKILRLQLD